MSQIKIISEWIDGSTRKLDVDQAASITLKKQLIDLTDINQRRGDYTQAFALPRTVNNDIFFGNWGDPSTIGGNWNTRVEAPAFILEDDNIIIQGVLKMESSDPEINKYYVSISGNVSTIKSILGESEMAQLDMTPWIYTAAQIFSTWTAALFSGDMIFPIHDFGFGWGLYKKDTAGTLTLQDFKNSATPIILDQTIPCFRLTKLMQMIFNEKGITVEGTFFSETFIDKVYVQADNALEVFATGVGVFTSRIVTTTILDSTTRVMAWGANPISGDFNNSTHTYTAPIAGDYTFDLRFTPTPGVPSNSICAAYYKVNAITVATINFNWGGTLNDSRTITLSAGDTVRIDWQLVAPGTSGSISPGGPDFWNLTNVVTSGTSVDPSAYWANHRQIDFIRSIFQEFNIIPTFDNEGKLQLDTWNEYMENQGEKKDWSEKVDFPSMLTRPINGELRNPVHLSLQPADNVINIGYQDSAGRPYGSYREDQNIPGTLPEAKAIEGFSPAAPQEIISSNPATNYPEVLICKYYQNEDSIAYKSPGLQLMYYNGARTIPTAIYTTDSAGGGTTARTIYPYFSNFQLISAFGYQVIAGSYDLNFTWWTPPSPAIVAAQTSNNLFVLHFREMIRERYDEGSKIIEMNVLLNAADIQNFSFADTIIVNVNGTPVGLRIVEIKDYSPNTQRLTKVKAYITFIE